VAGVSLLGVGVWGGYAFMSGDVPAENPGAATEPGTAPEPERKQAGGKMRRRTAVVEAEKAASESAAEGASRAAVTRAKAAEAVGQAVSAAEAQALANRAGAVKAASASLALGTLLACTGALVLVQTTKWYRECVDPVGRWMNCTLRHHWDGRPILPCHNHVQPLPPTTRIPPPLDIFCPFPRLGPWTVGEVDDDSILADSPLVDDHVGKWQPRYKKAFDKTPVGDLLTGILPYPFPVSGGQDDARVCRGDEGYASCEDEGGEREHQADGEEGGGDWMVPVDFGGTIRQRARGQTAARAAPQRGEESRIIFHNGETRVVASFLGAKLERMIIGVARLRLSSLLLLLSLQRRACFFEC
jgi:hypothetical protein